MQSIKDVINDLDRDGKVTMPKQMLEKTVFVMYNYYLDHEPEGEFMTNYRKQIGDEFKLLEASKYYLNKLAKYEVEIEIDDINDVVNLSK